MKSHPSFWPLLILAAGLVATVAGVRTGLAARQATNEAEFDAAAMRMAEDIDDRLTRPRYGLAGARGTAASLGRLPDVTEFRRYVRSRHLEREFPGVTGMGVIEPVHRDAVDEFEGAMSAQHGAQFRVHGESPHEWRYVIRSIEPLEPNRAALGFDTGSEPNRRAALERSAQLGEPAATAPVQLRQDVQQRAGALYVLPVFASGGSQRADASDRTIAWMYVAVVYDELLKSATRSDRLHVELRDLGAQPGQQLVYRSSADTPQAPTHVRQLPLEFGGRPFRLDIASTPVLEASQSTLPVWMAGALGVLASLLGALLVWQLERSRRRALRIADQLTRDFQAQSKELATSHAFLDRTGTVAGVGSWEIDLATGAVKWSEQIRRILEAPPHYRPGIDGDLELFFSEEARPRIRAAVERAIQDGTPWDLLVPITTFRGTPRWVRSAGDAERENGNVVRLLGALLDVTELHENALELERSRSVLQTTLRSIGDAVLTADLDANVQWLNPEAERLTGWRSADAAGRPVTDVLTLEIDGRPERAVCPIQTCLAEQRAVGLEPDTVLVARDGTRYFIDDSAAPLRADDGHLLGVVMVFRDITARRDLERQTALARSRRELVELTDSLTEGFLVVDRDWNILGANPALGEMFALDTAASLGRSMWECLPQFEAPTLSEALHLTRRTQRRHDIELVLPDQRILAGRVHPHHAGLALNLWDETAQRRHQERLERSSDLFRAVNRAALVAVRKLGDPDLLQVLTEELRNAVDAHLATIHLLPIGDEPRPPPAVSLSDKYAAWRNFDRPIKGLGLLAEAAKKRGVMRLTQDELLAHPAFLNYGDAGAQHPPLRGLLSVSLVERSGRVLGFLQVSDRREGEFDDDDVAICVQFGQLAAITIEWGRHLEQLESAHREVEQRLHELRGQKDLLGAAERLAGSASWLLVRHGEAFEMEWSRALSRMLGLEPGAGAPSIDALLAHVQPEDRDGVQRAIDSALRFGAEATVEHRMRTPQAAARWVRHRIRVLDHDGSVRVLGTVQELGNLDGGRD